MISIFEDLFIEKKIKLDIEKYIGLYSAKYSGDRKNYSNSEDFCHYIYSEYSRPLLAQFFVCLDIIF